MAGARPEQAVLTRDTDMSKTEETRRVIEGMVDFPHVLAQLGVDVFGGEGWEAYDRGEKTPPAP
ncbi:MAG: hypothetical protein MRY75_07960 [Marivita sp.]|uniref:hypothetical protein n=1 Tax=Marivita sp. TaxID=2003365 RepID=UPI0025BA6C01|nr:hypothetical protein [Marivita sp.]MCI5110477.1 hypothetical protein [Marivita sp.]